MRWCGSDKCTLCAPCSSLYLQYCVKLIYYTWYCLWWRVPLENIKYFVWTELSIPLFQCVMLLGSLGIWYCKLAQLVQNHFKGQQNKKHQSSYKSHIQINVRSSWGWYLNTTGGKNLKIINHDSRFIGISHVFCKNSNGTHT